LVIREELTDEWKQKGILERKKYAILTAEISNDYSGPNGASDSGLNGATDSGANSATLEAVFC